MNRFFDRLIKCSVGGLIVLGVAGCAGPGTRHAEAVTKATQGWKDTRSAMILQSAQSFFDTGDLDQAEVTLLEAVTIDPQNSELHLLAGRVALERGQLERSHGRLQKAIDLDPKLPEARYYQGIVLQRWQKYDAALNRYREAYDLQADNMSYLLAVSEMLVACDRSSEAVDLLAGKLNYFDQSAAIRVALGQLYLMKGSFSESADHFRKAMILQPEDDSIREDYVTALMGGNQYAEAIKSLERLTKRYSMEQRADLHRMLAGAYEGAGRIADARNVYQNLKRDNPRDIELWIKLGELAWRSEDYSTALTAGQRVISLSADRYEGYTLCGLVWQKREMADRALEMFDRAAKLAPDKAEPLILRGITLQRDGRTAEAAAAYAEALRRQPDDARARRLLVAVTATAE